MNKAAEDDPRVLNFPDGDPFTVEQEASANTVLPIEGKSFVGTAEKRFPLKPGVYFWPSDQALSASRPAAFLRAEASLVGSFGPYKTVRDAPHIKRGHEQVVRHQVGTQEAQSQKANTGGKRGGGTMDSETKTYIDAKTETTKALNDARFADLRADIATLIAKMDAAPTQWTTWSAVGVTVGILLAAFAIAGDRFDGGVGLASLSVQQAEDAKRISTGNSERMDEIDQKLDVLIRLIGEQKKP